MLPSSSITTSPSRSSGQPEPRTFWKKVKRARAAVNKRPSQRSADAYQNRCLAVKVTGVARAVEIILPVILFGGAYADVAQIPVWFQIRDESEPAFARGSAVGVLVEPPVLTPVIIAKVNNIRMCPQADRSISLFPLPWCLVGSKRLKARRE
jgi:hypothetical protein